jgi:hypothetical protein
MIRLPHGRRMHSRRPGSHAPAVAGVNRNKKNAPGHLIWGTGAPTRGVTSLIDI